MSKFATIKKREINTHTSMQKKHPGGRPKKDPSQKRSEKVFLNLTKEEKKRLEELAKEEEIALGVLVRKLLKNHGYI